jgi:uncharacterized protein YdeI (YjbR/CyaY-like superfamily)
VTDTDSKTFRATLERLRGKGTSWVIARVPFSVQKLWKTRGSLRVQAEVNGYSYKTALLPTRAGRHFLLINKKVQNAAHITEGSKVELTLVPDRSPRVLRLPEELEIALKEDRALRKWFDRLNHSTRKWFAGHVADAKSPDTRKRRAERAAEHLMETMEAEIDLPPTLHLALSRHPGAMEAWSGLSPTQRRHHLLSILHYRTPESRMNRIQRMIESIVDTRE